MHLWLYQISGILAQAGPWDDNAPPETPAPVKRPMSFSDLRQGLREYSTGANNDNSLRNGLLVLMAIVGVVALILHYHQRNKNAGPKDSMASLAWELGRKVRFPLGTRAMLWWVARTSKVPMASLLLSAGMFEKCVSTWTKEPTFSLFRKWGRRRLERLKPTLFG